MNRTGKNVNWGGELIDSCVYFIEKWTLIHFRSNVMWHTFPLDINECLKKPCQCGNGTTDCCVDTLGGYVCKCKDGYRLARKNICVDRNECWQNPDNCPSMSECVNTPGSFTCKCIEGFKMDSEKKKCIRKQKYHNIFYSCY